MTKAIWLFEIYLPKEGEAVRSLTASSCVVLRDRHLFGKLYSILNRFLRPAFSSERLHSVAIEESTPELELALLLLADVGLMPVFQSLVTPEQRGIVFPVRRERAAFPLDSSNWLQLMCVNANRGGEVLTLQDHQLVARADKLESKRPGHCLDLTFRAFAVTEDFKKSFEDAGLSGAVFRPLVYDPPMPNCQRQYWMDTSVTAPWSPWIRRIDTLDNPVDMVGVVLKETNAPLIGFKGSVGFDDEGYYGPGMAYRRADMASVDGVDFMRQAEWTAEHNGVWLSEHIVSQRFRAWAKKFGCRFVMNGVMLVD